MHYKPMDYPLKIKNKRKVIQTNPTFNCGHTDSPSIYQLLYITALEERCALEQGRQPKAREQHAARDTALCYPSRHFKGETQLNNFPGTAKTERKSSF
jgi:hypothetical protein